MRLSSVAAKFFWPKREILDLSLILWKLHLEDNCRSNEWNTLNMCATSWTAYYVLGSKLWIPLGITLANTEDSFAALKMQFYVNAFSRPQKPSPKLPLSLSKLTIQIKICIYLQCCVLSNLRTTGKYTHSIWRDISRVHKNTKTRPSTAMHLASHRDSVMTHRS